MRNVTGLLLGILLPAALLQSEGAAVKAPVLLELFTSEGCSSCPPADRLLEKLDREQPIAGAEVVVLSEHVDYWNHLGWSDPFSSPLYSTRQRDYANRLDGQTYTPELVVDGVKGFVGSDAREAERAVKDAARQGKAAIRVTAERNDKKGHVVIHLDPSETLKPGAVVYLALAHDAMKSQVSAGENAGRGLTHVAVAYSIEKVGKVDGKVWEFDKTVDLKAGEKTRVIAFVSQSGTGRVIALGQTRL